MEVDSIIHGLGGKALPGSGITAFSVATLFFAAFFSLWTLEASTIGPVDPLIIEIYPEGVSHRAGH